MAWLHDLVAPDKIDWCDCVIGQAQKVAYETQWRDRKKQAYDQVFQRAGIPPRFKNLTFDSLPAVEGKEKAVAAARMFADWGHVDAARIQEYDPSVNNGHIPEVKTSLCFIGQPGVGKTGILSVAFRYRVETGQAGLWIELYDFFADIQSNYGRDKFDNSSDEQILTAKRAELLFLDDCGDPDRKRGNNILPESHDKRSLLWQVLGHRHSRQLPTLITSNLSQEKFRTQWGRRLADRVWEMAWVIVVSGQDLRDKGAK